MTTQPKYHWQFNERKGHVAQDSLRNLTAKFHKTCSWKGHGRIGQAIQLGALDSRIVFDDVIDKFGTNDFTVAFGIKILNVHGQNDMDLIGNRNVGSHGNWFSLRLEAKGTVLTFEVDETSKGKHFAKAKTKSLSSLPNQKWHHIALVRKGKVLKIFLDGELVAKGVSKTGVANIKSSVDVKLGHHTRHTPTAQYEDLRIYYSALNQEEIKALIPPYNPPLQEGEIELMGTDDASIILTQDVDNLSSYSADFQTLRLGHNTGVTLYNQSHFKGVAQKCYAELPDIRRSRLKDLPRSVRIWSTVGEPFTGMWFIQAPNGQFLSIGKSALSTSPLYASTELFRLHHNIQQSRLQLIPGVDHESAAIKVSPELGVAPLYVDESESLTDKFSLVNHNYDQWLALSPDDSFHWTEEKSDRAVFTRAAKFAENEGQVGELTSGEVALYQHVAYCGPTWILSNSQTDRSGHFTNFSDFRGLNDQTSSIRVGPDTGMTLFRNFDFHVADGNGEKEIEDIVDNVPNLSESQVGNDTISSIKIFRTIDPTEIFTSYTSKLSQDYRMVGEKLEEFSAYRTILRLEPDAGDIEVSATDLTKIEVDGENYEIDEQRSVTLKPNAMNHIMITSEADGIDTPGLKFRTQSMAPNERAVIFPNQDVHRQIAELEDDALWNATDTQGNLIVDQKAHGKEEVASVQNTIKRMMGTVTYADNESTVSTRSVTKSHRNSVGAAARSVSGATIEDHPWELNLGKVTPPNQVVARKSGAALAQAKSLTSSVATTGIEEKEISQDEFARLLSQSTSREKAVPPEPSKGFGTINGVAKRGLLGSIGRGIKKAVKKATSVVVGVVKGVVHVLVKTLEGVIDFVVDTVKKVVEFVEAVVETVVKAVKKFIEFLQFLFNWGDILDTQRYLKGAINTSLDSAKQLAVDAKPHVKSFVDDLQDGVEDGMNHLVKTLGGKPSEVEESGFEIPEALEWFLSKFLGGSKSSDSEDTSDSGSDDSPLASFVRQMLEAFEDAVGAGLRLSEGVFDSIQTLIANPRQPEVALIVIIEAFRDAIIQSLDAVENVALSLLDVVGLAIDLFQGLLNAEIRIPFISDLLDFIGVGKLTVLNLATIILAIPVTVTAKLVTGQNLFTSSTPMPLDFVNQTGTPLALANVTTKRSVRADSTDASNSDSTAATDEPDSIRDLRKDLAFTTIVTLADTTNHLIAGILDLFDVPGFEVTGGGDLDLSRLDESLGLIGSGFVGPLQGLEITSLILSFMSWSFSYPAQFEESGGTNKERRRESILWGYRGGTLALDAVLMMKQDFQRMRRVEKASNVIWALLSTVDMILFSLYLAAVEEENERIKRADISNEVFSWLPNVASFVRSLEIPDPLTRAVVHLGHVGTDVAAAVVTTTTGGILIREANKALKEAG